MLYLNAQHINELFRFEEFIPYLQKAFTQDIEVPQRQHYTIPNKSRQDATLLIMPAWQHSHRIGIKVVNVFPDNQKLSLPSIQGTYLLYSATNGRILCSMDGKELTAKRTAAASALASTFLSKKDANRLLIIGTGVLCHELIKAHASSRPVDEVWIWGRNYEKALIKAADLFLPGISIKAVENKEEYIPKADIISCATLSQDALVYGDLLKDGCHLDLVGSFTPTAREADDSAIKKSSVFIDTESATFESGDLFLPLKNKILKPEEIRANLTQLCKKERLGRQIKGEITMFKSVGYALEDLAAASYLFDKYTEQNI